MFQGTESAELIVKRKKILLQAVSDPLSVCRACFSSNGNFRGSYCILSASVCHLTDSPLNVTHVLWPS
jgi:hypothetical protein